MRVGSKAVDDLVAATGFAPVSPGYEPGGMATSLRCVIFAIARVVRADNRG